MLAMTIKPNAELAAVINRFRSFGPQVDVYFRKVVFDSASIVVIKAKEKAPVSTGFFRRSIRFALESAGLSAVIGSDVPYGPALEFIERMHPVRPPLHRTRDTKLGKIGSIIKGSGQTNPAATSAPLRKSLYEEGPTFISNLEKVVRFLGR